MWDFINSSPARTTVAGVLNTRIENAESRAIVEAYNTSIQEIAHYAPRDFFKKTQSAVLKAPITSTVSVTEDSTSFTDLLLTEDDTSKAAESPTASSGSAVFSLSSHGFNNGDIVKFTGNKPFTSSQEQFFVIQAATNEFRLSETFYGNQLTASSSGSFQIQKQKTIDPTGSSVDVGGDDNTMRIKSIDIPKVHSFTARKRYTTTGNHKLRFFIATTEEQVGDPEHVFNQLNVGDQIQLQGFTGTLSSDTSGPHYNTTTEYFITRKTIDETDILGTASGISDVYGGYIDISTTLDGNDPISGGTANQDSLMIDGAAGTYSFIKKSDKGKKSSGEFYEPYIGTTGSKSATIHFDSIKLPSNVSEVMGTVVLNDKTVLKPFMNDDHSARLHRDRIYDEDYTDDKYDMIPDELTDKSGEPYYYFIDSEHNDTTNGQDLFMRLRPFPKTKARLRFSASVLPEKMPQKDAYSNTGNSEATGCPAGYEETVLMAFVYKNFIKYIGFEVLPSEGSLQSGNILLQIDEDYRQAIEILKGLEPQSERQPIYGVVY
jgi:hypothetical protein